MPRTLILTAGIVALAAPLAAAAKPVIDNEAHLYLTDQVFGVRVQKLQVRAVQWGSAPSGGGANELRMNDAAGSADAAKERQAGMSDIKAETDKSEVAAGIEVQRKDLVAESRMQDSRQTGGHSMLGASDRVTVGGAQTASGQATGRRVHKPLRVRMYYDEPQGGGPGALVVQGSLPGCTVGKRYAGMQFAAGGMRYELKDVVISNCPTAAGPKEEISFVYGTVKVRGWDPKKKEE